MDKVPAYKRILRSIKIITLNTLFFPLRLKKFKDFINHVYLLEPCPQEESKIADVYIEEIFPDIQKKHIVLKDLESKYGSMTLEEIYDIALLVRHINPDFVFEFGTFIGVTTLQMALNSNDFAKIYTLNLQSADDITKYAIGNSDEERNLPSHQPGGRFKRAGLENKITQLYGDSAQYDFSEYADKMDLILIDASHEYEYVKSDTINSFKMLKKGGTLVWHDYPNAPGVYRYLNELSAKIKIYHLKDTHICISVNFNRNEAL
jgi:predicted O-methyltransferase YrrM